MSTRVSGTVFGTVWAILFLAFLSGVIMRPSVETVMAAGAATIVLLKIAYDYMSYDGDPDVDAMFE